MHTNGIPETFKIIASDTIFAVDGYGLLCKVRSHKFNPSNTLLLSSTCM